MQKCITAATLTLYRDVLCHFFHILRLFLRFLHFAPWSAFARKVKEFHRLFFCDINKTRNSREIRKVYSECFIFCDVFHEFVKWENLDRERSKVVHVPRRYLREEVCIVDRGNYNNYMYKTATIFNFIKKKKN